METSEPVDPPVDDPEDGPDPSRAFAGVGRLLGDVRARALADAHAVVIGLGGVGSWAAEALARSGVGRLTLIDMDHVAESNLNRQVLALHSTVGASKIQVMADRIRDINPDCQVDLVDEFVTTRNVADVIPADADAVIDAIDQNIVKAAVISHCRQQQQWLVVCGAAGALTDPLAIETKDLGLVCADPMLARLRKRLRRHYGFERGHGTRFGIPAIFSTEKSVGLMPETAAGGADSDGLPDSRLACNGYGSIVTVTATMGMAAAAATIRVVQDKGGESGAQCHPPANKPVVTMKDHP